MIGKYIWNVPDTREEEIASIKKKCSCSRALATYLASKGISTKEAIESYLKPDFSMIRTPYELPGVEIAAKRIWEAIHRKENILIFGDYDTDGVTGSVLLYEVLRDNGANVCCFLPHRFDDGYGMMPETLQKALMDNSVSLIITVDCGISAIDAVLFAKAKNIDVIISDHHEPPEKIPEAFVVIDPKLHNGCAGLHILAGVGVAFKLAQGFLLYGMERGFCNADYDLKEYLDLVALGTVADLVPLIGENRIMVHCGLKKLSEQLRPGINALCESVGIKSQVKSSDITYSLSPRLNAAGRLEDAKIAFKLLTERNHVLALRYADEINKINQKRQEKESEITQAVIEQIEKYSLEKKSAILVHGNNWNLGVLGIVASKIAREYNRPTIVFSVCGDSAYGSARSIENLNILEILSECAPLLNRYGGHTMAAGLALNSSRLGEFIGKFEESVEKFNYGIMKKPSLKIDGVLGLSDIDEIFFRELPYLEPFGYGNQEPLFKFEKLKVKKLQAAARIHSKGVLCDDRGFEFDFIAFNISPEELNYNEYFDVAATPQINKFRGMEYPQLQVHDFKQSTATRK